MFLIDNKQIGRSLSISTSPNINNKFVQPLIDMLKLDRHARDLQLYFIMTLTHLS
jgi:hypothetical protein